MNRLEIDSYEWDKLVLSSTTWTKDTHSKFGLLSYSP